MSSLCLAAQDGAEAPDPGRIRAILQAFRSGHRPRIVSLVAYPIRRPYPIPPIRTPAECLRRFEELFDEDFISEIAASSLAEDWTRMGAKGIMFKNGALWLDDGYRILAVNHETAASRARMQALIDAQKAGLPARLRNFDRPVLEFWTSGGLIRVDRKDEDYRLVIFKGYARTLVLCERHQGRFQWDGNMGAYTIDWLASDKIHRVCASGPDGGGAVYQRFGPRLEAGDGQVKPEVVLKGVARRSR